MKEIYCRLCMKDVMHKLSFYDYVKQDQILCSECKGQLKRLDKKVKFHNLNMFILYEYNDFLENMIFQYKEGHDVALQDIFFYEDIKKLNDKFRQYAIVLLPSSQEKLQERGFLPVREMLSKCKLEILEPFFKSENHKQSLQSFEKRAYIRNVIHLKAGFSLPKKKLLIIDDVCTSGSTIKCAYDLLKKHTYRIEVLVLSAHPLFVDSCDKNDLKKKGFFSILGLVERIRKVK